MAGHVLMPVMGVTAILGTAGIAIGGLGGAAAQFFQQQGSKNR